MARAALPFFLDVAAPPGGRRFCVLHPPAGDVPVGAVVYVPPFAEEMNKSRRVAALQARALATAGHAVLLLDLFGCGDSDGQFADARWDGWVDDVLAAVAWLKTRHDAPLTLWGLRAGCLLAAEAARRASLACDVVFWQPSVAGKTVLQQFLRLDLARDLVEGRAAGSTERLRARLAAGEAVPIAGYGLAPAVADGLERAVLAPPAGARVTWLEVSPRDGPALLPASVAAIGRWRADGVAVEAAAVRGPAFWNAAEIEEAPALVAATLAAFERARETTGVVA